METKKYNIDDPQNVNSFLALIGGSQVSPLREPTRTTGESTEPEIPSNELAVSFCCGSLSW